MAERKHAILAPSSSKMWIECTPSVRLGENIPDQESSYAAEGTDAHELCEHKLRIALGMPSEDPTDHLKYYSPEMENCAVEYAAYVSELFENERKAGNNPVAMTEQTVDASRFAPECRGTADSIVIARNHLYITDYKHGVGVPVYAEGNTQMRIYALGALETFNGIYDIENVTMTIFQPRLNNISTAEISVKDLYDWAENNLKPRAELAFAGEGELHSGPWCQFCKVKATCRKRAEENLELAKFEFRTPELLSDDEIGEVLSKADEIVSWANDVRGYTISRMLGGKRITGFKLVEGRSVRRYSDETAAAEAVKKAGYDPYEHKILGITAMTGLLGKKQFNDILGSLIEKPHGKPTIAPESDPRPEFVTNDFTDLNA